MAKHLERLVFLDETWRLHPEICRFTSEIYYENKLRSRDDLVRQAIHSKARFAGAGLRYIPVAHTGNTARSKEEVEEIAKIIDALSADGVTWTDKDQVTKALTFEDILVVAARWSSHSDQRWPSGRL